MYASLSLNFRIEAEIQQFRNECIKMTNYHMSHLLINAHDLNYSCLIWRYHSNIAWSIGIMKHNGCIEYADLFSTLGNMAV